MHCRLVSRKRRCPAASKPMGVIIEKLEGVWLGQAASLIWDQVVQSYWTVHGLVSYCAKSLQVSPVFDIKTWSLIHFVNHYVTAKCQGEKEQGLWLWKKGHFFFIFSHCQIHSPLLFTMKYLIRCPCAWILLILASPGLSCGTSMGVCVFLWEASDL